MSTRELPMAPPAVAPARAPRDEGWLRAARRARQLSWASLVWMSIEGIVGLAAGFEANSLSLLIWAASSFVEGLASVTIIWRFTGARTHSATSERTAQRWVAGSFLLLVPYFLYESFSKLITGGESHANVAGVAVTASAIVFMPLLGWAKLRLARRLDSDATAGEGVQNLLCAAQAAAALVALIGASAGLQVLDPIAALVISAIAVRECTNLWRGNGDDCCAPIGFQDPLRATTAAAPAPARLEGTPSDDAARRTAPEASRWRSLEAAPRLCARRTRITSPPARMSSPRSRRTCSSPRPSSGRRRRHDPRTPRAVRASSILATRPLSADSTHFAPASRRPFQAKAAFH